MGGVVDGTRWVGGVSDVWVEKWRRSRSDDVGLCSPFPQYYTVISVPLLPQYYISVPLLPKYYTVISVSSYLCFPNSDHRDIPHLNEFLK